MDTNSSQVKLFDPIRRACVMRFGQAGTRPGALLYPYRIAVSPAHNLVRLNLKKKRREENDDLVSDGSTFTSTNDSNL